MEILVAREHDRMVLRRAAAAGDLEQLRRGAYRPVPEGEPGDRHAVARERTSARTAAVVRQVNNACVSHESAALLHGLRLWRLPEKVHVVQRYNASSAAASDIARHRADLADSDRVVLGGIPVTSLARTVADCSLRLHPLRALVLADHALSRGLDPADVAASVENRRDRRGRRRALKVLSIADAGAESAWESWLRYVLLRAGLVRPVTQLEIRTPHGRYRGDLGWLEHRVIAEFDGLVKYQRGDHRPGRALFEEKRREDHLREEGWIRCCPQLRRPDRHSVT